MKKAFLIMGGNFLLTIAATWFVEPSGLLCGGTTGIALVMKNMLGIPLSYTVLGFNILMLILAWMVLGKGLALSALVSSLLYPMFLQLIGYIPYHITFTDPWINVIFGGGLMGFGIGTVLRAGASSGGIDIPALIANAKLGIPVSVVLYGMDMVILGTQLIYSPVDRLPYSLIMILISSTMVNTAMVIGKNQLEATIVSICPERIVGRIQTELRRGATYLQVVTGYRREATQAVLCTLSSRELPRLKHILDEEDPLAFMTLVSAKEVRGRGFTLKKE